MTTTDHLQKAIEAIEEAKAEMKKLRLVGWWQSGEAAGAVQELDQAETRLTTLWAMHSKPEVTDEDLERLRAWAEGRVA
jgi:hypothetical protein